MSVALSFGKLSEQGERISVKGFRKNPEFYSPKVFKLKVSNKKKSVLKMCSEPGELQSGSLLVESAWDW